MGKCILFVLFFSILIVKAFESRLQEEYVARQKIEFVNIFPSKDQRMFYLFKAQCKDKYGSDYIDKYMTCTADKMEDYLSW